MGSISKHEGFAYRLRSQAIAGYIHARLRASFQLTAESFVQRMMLKKAIASWMRSPLIILILGLRGIPLEGATNSSSFEYPPPEVGSVQWHNIKYDTESRQKLYRKQLNIPDALGDDVPRSKIANFADIQKPIPIQTPLPTQSSGKLLNILFITFALTVCAVMIVHKCFPQFFTRLNWYFNPGWIDPVAEKKFSKKIRAEEEAFSGFLAAFRVGPTASPGMAMATAAQDTPGIDFYVQARKRLGTQRNLLQKLSQELNNLARQKILVSLLFEMRALKDAADIPEALPVWQVTSALEGLLKHLTKTMGHLTPSTLRAVVVGVDLLENLCASKLKLGFLTDIPFKFLVVDDDLISRQALSLALNKTFSQPDFAVDGKTALAQASQHAYDVIFLDVQMPGMDGFELCKKIRDATQNRNTPVVFVTGHGEFESRVKSVLSGGNDLMGKPFLTFEVIVKALTLAFQGRLHGQKSLRNFDQSKDKLAAPAMVNSVLRCAANAPIAPPPPLSESMAAESVKFTNTALTRRTKQLRPQAKLASVVVAATAETNNFSVIFLSRVSTQLKPLRDLCQRILQTADETVRQEIVVESFLRINALTANTDATVVHPARQMCGALEGMVKKLMENPKNANLSTLATFVSAVDLLNDLCVPGLKADFAINPPIRILVVDDDLVTRRVISGALQTVFEKPTSVENGEDALAIAMGEKFDVIFLDVVMPGMDGFETCSKIRKTTINRTTPLIYVTGNIDLNIRAQMTRSGCDDFVAKPFLTSEIAVKALTFALRGRLQQLKTPPVS